MNHTTRKIVLAAACLMTLVPALAVQSAENSEKPLVWGYGVKACSAYLYTYQGFEKGDARQSIEYYHYRDWLAGMVTGLSLATGEDVMYGAELDGAMRRLNILCDEHPKDDFFDASMEYLDMLKTPGVEFTPE